MNKKNEYFSEAVFDLTTIADMYRSKPDAEVVDSREVFTTIYNLAKEFIKANPDTDDEDYLDKVEEFGHPALAKLYGFAYPERPGILGYEVTYRETYKTTEFYFASSEDDAKEKMKRDIETEKIETSRKCEEASFSAKLVAIR